MKTPDTNQGNIMSQTLLPNGVLTVWESGHEEILPYKIDLETGEEYADLYPND